MMKVSKGSTGRQAPGDKRRGPGRRAMDPGKQRISIGLRLAPDVYDYLNEESTVTGLSKAAIVDSAVRYFRGHCRED